MEFVEWDMQNGGIPIRWLAIRRAGSLFPVD